MLMAARKFNDLCHLCLGNLICKYAANAHTMAMDMQHDLHRLFASLVEEPLENVNDEFHRRVVVVEDQNLVEAGFLGLGARFCDDAGSIAGAVVLAVCAVRVFSVAHATADVTALSLTDRGGVRAIAFCAQRFQRKILAECQKAKGPSVETPSPF